jgi:branched-subunit amino acid aminotransferase/4-amino-4-deoxychorismate lyase
MPAEERAFDLTESTNPEEAFLTSSQRGVASLVRVGAHSIGRGTPGERTRRSSRAYVALVAREGGA